MQWVETTGKTIDDAKEAALDQLGVDEDDAEFEILEEPRRGLFGLGGSEARVRARVRPRMPRAKDERRDRRRGRGRGRETDKTTGPARQESVADTGAAAPETGEDDGDGGAAVTEEISVEEQGELAKEFVAGLVDAFGVKATSVSVTNDDDSLQVAVEGPELGLLIGPKGQTLAAIEELTRTVVQRKVIGHHARLHVDVAGYREKRRAALERFTRETAERVLAGGRRAVLEPMNASDRKVVHDTVNAIEGVSTLSEGEEPRRRVVIVPEQAAD